MKLDNLHNLTAAECIELLKEVTGRDAKVRARLEAIKPAGKFGGGAGTERQRALMAGDVGTVRALDNEHADLMAEAEALKLQSESLQRRRQAALASEPVEGMPDRYKGIGDAVSAAEVDIGDLSSAMALVEDEYRWL